MSKYLSAEKVVLDAVIIAIAKAYSGLGYRLL
jgi:hypothetical protein